MYTLFANKISLVKYKTVLPFIIYIYIYVYIRVASNGFTVVQPWINGDVTDNYEASDLMLVHFNPYSIGVG